MCDVSDPRILNTYISIVDDEPTDWLILGYNGTKDTISLYAYGQGLSEFRNNFTNEILFGFFRMEGKFAFITFLPEQISGVTRARALVHSRYITSNLIEIHHVNISISRLTELNETNIRSKLKLSSNGTGRPLQKHQSQHQLNIKRRYSKRSSSAAFFMNQQQQQQHQQHQSMDSRRRKSDLPACRALPPLSPSPMDDTLSESNLKIHLLQHIGNCNQKGGRQDKMPLYDEQQQQQQVVLTTSMSTSNSVTSESTSTSTTTNLGSLALLESGSNKQQRPYGPTIMERKSSLALFTDEPEQLLNDDPCESEQQPAPQHTEEQQLATEELQQAQQPEKSVAEESHTSSSLESTNDCAEQTNDAKDANKPHTIELKADEPALLTQELPKEQKIHMRGYLSVIKNASPFRKRRFFILETDRLLLFQDDMSEQPMEMIQLKDLSQQIKAVSEDEQEDIYIPHSYLLRTKQQQDSFQLIADNKQSGKEFYTRFISLQQ